MKPSYKLPLKILLTIVIFGFIFYKVPFGTVLSAIKNCNPIYFLLAVSMRYAQRIVMGYRSSILAKHQGLAVGPAKLVNIGLIATFYGVFLPGTLAGGAVRWYKLNKLTSEPSKVLVMVIYDRMIDTVFMAALGFCFFLINSSSTESQQFGNDLFIAVVLFMAIYFLSFNTKLMTLITRIIANTQFIPQKIADKLNQLVNASANYSRLSISQHCKIFILSIAVYLIGVIAFFILAKGLNLELNFATLAWITSLVTAILMLPITFSGLGVREGGLIIMLEPYGIDPANALAFSLLMFASTLLLAAGGGACELYEQYFTKKR